MAHGNGGGEVLPADVVARIELSRQAALERRKNAVGSRGKADCCCLCSSNGICRRCSCVARGSPCTSCVPSRSNKCVNGADVVSQQQVRIGGQAMAGEASDRTTRVMSGPPGSAAVCGSVESRMKLGFGAQLVNMGDADRLNDGSEWFCRWRRLVSTYSGSVYDLPGGNVGKEFVGMLVDEMVMLSRKLVCSERLVVFCRVILQRDRLVKKGCDIRLIVKRRFDAWKNENFDGLVDEALQCTRHLSSKVSTQTQDHVLKVFTRLMLRDELRAATRWITERGSSRVLSPSDVVDSLGKTVLDVLKEKHPDPALADEKSFAECDDLPAAMMDVNVTSGHIERVARALHGGAGPGGTNSSHWQCFLLRYGTQSAKLRGAVAELVMVMANGVVDWSMIQALLSCRLIALDKNPGVRPIGVGEVLRRLMGKVMVLCTGADVQDACGADQLCSGLRGGIEGAIHAVRDMFEAHSEEGYGVLMVDAKNAFNSVNRVVGLWNARVYWPRCSKFLFNTYRGFSSLWIKDCADPLYSREGVTQGDPLSMCFYAVALLPLVRLLRCQGQWMQSWYADDSACVGRLNDVKEWFAKLSEVGPMHGYFPEPAKSVLVVDSLFKDMADSLFSDVGVKVVTGHRFLGGFVGEEDVGVEFVEKKVEFWMLCINCLADAAKSQPQAAFTSLM